MATYSFVRRNTTTGEPEVFGKLEPKTLLIEGPEADKVKFMLANIWSPLIGGKFDINNPTHVSKLPELINGSYLWVSNLS